MNEDDLRNSPVRHRWVLVRFCHLLATSDDEAVREAAFELLDELRSERYRGEFDVYDSQIQRNLRSERGG